MGAWFYYVQVGSKFTHGFNYKMEICHVGNAYVWLLELKISHGDGVL